MADREPHEVLGVARDASEDEVRAAYREMVKEHHPDVSDAENAEERFVSIRDAYEVMRERAGGKGTDGAGNGRSEHPTGDVSEGKTGTKSTTKSEHRGRRREKRKRWEDPWEEKARRKRREADEKHKSEQGESGTERVGNLGYGWTVYREGDMFTVSKTGGRGRVYIGDGGQVKKEKYRFPSREKAEEAYEEHVTERDRKRDTSSLGDGWRLVERASGYAVEGAGGYLGFDGSVRQDPYWFRSREEAVRVYESHIRGDDERAGMTEDDSLASRVTVGAALLPFLATVTVLSLISSSLGLGAKGKNPYLATALTSAVFVGLAIVFRSYFLSYVLLFLAIWAGVEFVVMAAGPYTADEIEGQ
jgi:curved DNA-binding protein CbpA